MPEVIERLKEALTPNEPREIPKSIEDRIKRGRERMKDGATEVTECFKFWRGKQYWYRDSYGNLTQQNTVTNPDRSGKPSWRIRRTRNLIKDIVGHEVSNATQRVPAYEINPSTADPEDVSAARLASKVARYGYDKWKVRLATKSVVTFAVVGDEGFAWPYWDSSVGPYIPTVNEEGETSVIGQGEVRIRVFGRNEVFWEPGLRFEDSPWHAIEQARTLESVYEMEGFIKGTKLTADANSAEAHDMGESRPHTQLCLVTDYLERPCAKYPRGRWLTMAAGKQIAEERPYPLVDVNGEAVDEPVLHKLAYVVDPDSDRDLGLVRDLLDAQRTVNDCTNKQLEWKNLCLNPQMVVRNGELLEERTDEPGAVYTATGSGEIVVIQPPQIPGELSEIKQEAIADMARMAAQNDIPSQVESGRGIAALLEKDANRRADFIADLADFHSRLMRHCLVLVQRHYTERRTLPIVGRTGPDRISDFLGAQLRGQVDVTVLPGSIEPRTRAANEQKIMSFAQQGWITPEAAMAAINGGTAESLANSYELDVARANEVIQMIRGGTFLRQPPRPVFAGEDPGFEVEPEYQLDQSGQPMLDPMSGEPIVLVPGVPATTMPGWMPRPFDNPSVHLSVLSDWMKTPSFTELDEEGMRAANAYYAALQDIEIRKAQRDAELQNQQASALGMQNAAKPQVKQMPDQLQLDTENTF